MRCVATFGVSVVMAILASGCSQPGEGYVETSLQRYVRSRPPGATVPRDVELSAKTAQSRTRVPLEGVTWLSLGERLSEPSQGTRTPSFAERPEGFVHWRRRRGPAYPGDVWRSFGRDAKELPATMWDDTKAAFTNKWALVGLTAAVAAGVGLDAANANGRVGDHYIKHGPQLNPFWDSVGDIGGNPGLHFAVAGAIYFTSLYRDDVRNYEVSKALINALAINGLATIAMKGIVRSESPNGDDSGWPSGHTSSTFCLATVMYQAYGPWVGVPLFAFATYVGYERVDAMNHDFNDVISGALIGIVIGYAVYDNHAPRILGMDIIPYANLERSAFGVALSKEW